MTRREKGFMVGFPSKILILSAVVAIAVSLLHLLYIYPLFRNYFIQEAKRESITHAGVILHELDEVWSPGLSLENTDVVSLLRDHRDWYREGFEIEKMKVYSSDGTILYSPNPEEIGKTHPNTRHWLRVASGETVTKFVRHDSETLEGETFRSDVMETYIPIISNGRVLGAMELYQDISVRKSQYDVITHRASILTLGITGVLLLFIGLVSLRAERTERRRKRLEEQLIRADHLAAMGTLVGGMAHEFNNINLSVMGFSEVALDHGDLDPVIRNCLERVHRAAKRAHSITNNLLEFSRGRKRLPDKGNMKTVVLDALSLVKSNFEKEGIVIETSLETVPDSPMDSDQITQVVLNVLTNARHAMLGCPKKIITVATARDGDRVLVSVSDTGCGIAEEDVERIFNPFFSTKGERAVDSRQSQVKGTGLGLSICHTIVRNHGGEISVKSRPEAGATFTIALPVERRKKERNPGGGEDDVSAS